MVLPYSSTDYGEDQGGAINIQELIVPSSTAFDPTEDESTGTMKAIHDYIATLIDIEPPVFAGSFFTDELIPGGTITSISQTGADLDGEATEDYSGWQVAMNLDGTIVAVGAYGVDVVDEQGALVSKVGHVRVYQLSNGTWSQLGADIDGKVTIGTTDTNRNDGFPLSLSSDGTTLAIGAPSHRSYFEPEARVYRFSSGSWTQLGSTLRGDGYDFTGNSVSLSSDGNIIAVGAYLNDANGNDKGRVRVYQFSSGSWTQLGSDIYGEATNDQSGYSVSLSSDGTILAVGAPKNNSGQGSDTGHVRVYQFSSGVWSQLGADIDGEAASDQSGYSVSLNSDGTILAVGAEGNDGNGSNSGHVRVYQFSSGSWSQLGADIDGEAANDNFGTSVSLSDDGTILAVGGHFNDGNGSNSGHVRVYEFSSGSWTQLGSDINGEAANDNFGISVALSGYGNQLAIGAPFNDGTNGTDSGHTRVFELVGRMKTATGTMTASVGDTFNPFTDNGTITCTDTFKGTTQIFTLTGDNFEFRTQIEGNLDDFGIPFSTSVVPIGDVLDNLNNGAWQPSSTWKTANTYYLRYKATDLVGNETPNDASHYLTVIVSS
jgi:hypothetical protein